MIPHFHQPIISNTKADNMLWSRGGLSSKETTDKWLAPVISNQNSVINKKNDYPVLYYVCIFIHFKQYMHVSNIYTKHIYKLYAYKSTNEFSGLQYKCWWDRDNTHTETCIDLQKKFQYNAILPHNTNNIYKYYELATWKSVLILKAFSTYKLKFLITMTLVLDINSLSFSILGRFQ